LDLCATAPDPSRADALLFHEAPSRIVVACAPASLADLRARAAAGGVALIVLGTTGGDPLTLRRGTAVIAHVALSAAADAWQHGLARALAA
ncbi:MAG: hypothetical protein M3Z04_18205, partial [Chloroflexota bacterium]|nr:hypothetical protein [Chloroflexota bacterium]